MAAREDARVSRLFVSGLERRLPAALGQVDERTRVPRNAIIVQTALAALFTIVTFGPWTSSSNFPRTFGRELPEPAPTPTAAA